MNKHRNEKITIPFDGNYRQLDQLLMRGGGHGHWNSTLPGTPKIYDFMNGVRLVWLARQKRIELVGGNLRFVESMEKHLIRLLKRYGFMDDHKKLASRFRDLILALSPPVATRDRLSKARRQTLRLPSPMVSPQNVTVAKPKRGDTQSNRKPRSRS